MNRSLSSIFLSDMIFPSGIEIFIYDQEQNLNIEEKCFLKVGQSFIKRHSDFV